MGNTETEYKVVFGTSPADFEAVLNNVDKEWSLYNILVWEGDHLVAIFEKTISEEEPKSYFLDLEDNE